MHLQSIFLFLDHLIYFCNPNICYREFHHKGLSVVATARNQESMSELREMGLLTLTLDVTSEMSIKVI